MFLLTCLHHWKESAVRWVRLQPLQCLCALKEGSYFPQSALENENADKPLQINMFILIVLHNLKLTSGFNFRLTWEEEENIMVEVCN